MVLLLVLHDKIHEKVQWETCIVCDARDLVRPYFFLLQGVVRIALRQEVLEKAHVLEAEQGNLVMGL